MRTGRAIVMARSCIHTLRVTSYEFVRLSESAIGSMLISLLELSPGLIPFAIL